MFGVNSCFVLNSRYNIAYGHVLESRIKPKQKKLELNKHEDSISQRNLSSTAFMVNSEGSEDTIKIRNISMAESVQTEESFIDDEQAIMDSLIDEINDLKKDAESSSKDLLSYLSKDSFFMYGVSDEHYSFIFQMAVKNNNDEVIGLMMENNDKIDPLYYNQTIKESLLQTARDSESQKIKDFVIDLLGDEAGE